MQFQLAYFVLLTAAALLIAGVPQSRAAEGAANARADFYVATNGNDGWSGKLAAPNADRTDGPFATITRARDAVRQARAQQAGPCTVLIRGGTYYLTEPIVFGPEDSGTEAAPITYAAYPNEAPAFSGGRVITGWKKGKGEVWTAEVPEVKAGDWYFHQLFVNGERRTRARTPNDDYLRTDGPLKPLKDRNKARRDPSTKMGFKFKAGDLKRWDNLQDVNLFVYHSWTASVHWIAELDEANRTVRFTAPSGWPIGWWEKNQRYYVENYLEALDSPGEWYLDRKTGVLHYWPLQGEDLTKIEVVAPRLQHLVMLQGEAELGLAVEYLTLRGLSFQHADWLHDRDKSADGQAAVHLSAALVATGARHCSLENCEIAHVGEYALILGEGCKYDRVFHCHIHDLGGGGVRIGQTSRPKEPLRQADHNVVDNCFIHDGGKVFRAGIGVWIGRSSYNTVSHNEICDFDYSACSVGWSWGYAASTANHNIFEYNHLHDIGRGVLSDMGGIYSLGVSPGTIERFNLIHDIYSYSYGGWGLYTDEGSSEILLENNIVYNTKTGGFHQHYGRDNILRNNIFAFSRQAQIIRSRQEDHNSFNFEHNIVYCDNGEILGGNWGNGNYHMDYNLYWDTSEADLDFDGLDFEEWQAKGRDRHSIIKDPMFVDAQNYDFGLKPGSPAEQIGFRPIDTSEIGLYGDAEWVNAPKKIVRRPIEFPPPPGPQPLDEGFEQTGIGEPPPLARVSGLEKGAAIQVTDEVACTGRHCLKFTDAPGLEHDWQPHMVYQPRFDRGIACLSYDVRLEEGAIFWNEWRDSHRPYRVGPSVRIEKTGELKANNQTLMRVPRGKWLHLEFVCPLGKHSTGTYDLTATIQGQAPQKFEKISVGSPQFKRLRWLGFISLATDTAVFYLDNLKLEQQDR